MLDHIGDYALLMRLNKPIGWLLLLWPTLWGLWIASEGHPNVKIFFIFVMGVWIMRAAGCVVNDLADKDFDPYVERTRNRPIASGRVKPQEAMMLALILFLVAFELVLFLNPLTIKSAFFGALVAIAYPFMKRFIHFPQVILGIAFSFGIPMAFAALRNALPFEAWFLFLLACLWPVIYDTMYAMADRDDDLKIGVKSTAILFGHYDRLIIAILQIVFFSGLTVFGISQRFHFYYYLGLLIAVFFSVYQHYLIKKRNPKHCFKAFINNNWVGASIFAGIVLNYSLQ